MPVKHVRFARTKTVLPSPYDSTPSPSYSQGFLPSSSSVTSSHRSYTPSRSKTLPYDYNYHHRHHSQPQPAPHSHPILAYGSNSPVKYDVRYSPSSIAPYDPRSFHHALSEPATFPAMSRLILVSPRMPQWKIRVEPLTNGSYVTVSDVFSAVSRSLRTNVTASEYNHIGDSDRRRVSRAYEDRYRNVKSSTDRSREKTGGIKRVDFLVGHNMFTGLSTADPAAGVWVMNVS